MLTHGSAARTGAFTLAWLFIAAVLFTLATR